MLHYNSIVSEQVPHTACNGMCVVLFPEWRFREGEKKLMEYGCGVIFPVCVCGFLVEQEHPYYFLLNVAKSHKI